MTMGLAKLPSPSIFYYFLQPPTTSPNKLGRFLRPHGLPTRNFGVFLNQTTLIVPIKLGETTLKLDDPLKKPEFSFSFENSGFFVSVIFISLPVLQFPSLLPFADAQERLAALLPLLFLHIFRQIAALQFPIHTMPSDPHFRSCRK